MKPVVRPSIRLSDPPPINMNVSTKLIIYRGGWAESKIYRGGWAESKNRSLGSNKPVGILIFSEIHSSFKILSVQE